MPDLPTANRVRVRREPAGNLGDGTAIEAITLANAHRVSARILTYGATLQSLFAPDARGALADIVLGHDDVTGYERHRAYLGSTIGRYANRIAGGRFTLDGQAFQLQQNVGRNSLHGGDHGFDRAVWRVISTDDGAAAAVTLGHVSPDGEGGFPAKCAPRSAMRSTPAAILPSP